MFHSLVAYLLSGIKMGSAGNVRSCNILRDFKNAPPA